LEGSKQDTAVPGTKVIASGAAGYDASPGLTKVIYLESFIVGLGYFCFNQQSPAAVSLSNFGLVNPIQELFALHAVSQPERVAYKYCISVPFPEYCTKFIPLYGLVFLESDGTVEGDAVERDAVAAGFAVDVEGGTAFISLLSFCHRTKPPTVSELKNKQQPKTKIIT
jgi:hypothetical protein